MLNNQRVFATKKKLKNAFDNKNFANYDSINEVTNKLQNLKNSTKLDIKHYFIYESNMYFVSEYIEYGNLTDFLKENILITESKAKIIIKQVIDFIRFCHYRCIKHNNLHPNNILFVDDRYNKIKVNIKL